MLDYVFKRKKTWISVFLLDLIGNILFLFKSKDRPKSVMRILVIRLDHLGDLVMSTPFFTKLRELYPAAEIHLMADENYLTLFEGDMRFDQLIPLTGHWFSRRSPVRWFYLFQRALELRRFNYDLGFDLRGDIRTIFFFLFLAGVKHRVSYGVRGGSFLLNHCPIYPRRAHETERNVNLLASLTNKDIQTENPYLEIRTELKNTTMQKLVKLGRNRLKKLIGVHLGAGYPSKQWGVDHYTKVLEALIDKGSYQICLLGSRQEVVLTPDFLAQEDVINLLGATNLKDLAAVTSLCDAFIGNDSGPAHLAGALGIPVLSVFSGTNRFEEFRPRAEVSEIVHKDLECSPCEEQICPLKHHHCMSLITVDDVLESFKKLAIKAEKTKKSQFKLEQNLSVNSVFQLGEF